MSETCANNLVETTDGPMHFCVLPDGHPGLHKSPDGVTTWRGPCGEEREAIARVRGLHRSDGHGWCVHCSDISDGAGEAMWPCTTTRALDGGVP